MSKIKSRKHRPATQLLALAAVGLPLVSHAATENDVVQLPTIEVQSENEGYKTNKVSSDKFTQPLVDTTQTISVIKSEVLQEQTANTLTEALRNVPGVGSFNIGENGRMNTGDSISMRGFYIANSIFVDGVRDLGNITRDVFNTDQIEVFKGAAGTDNGRTAATGSVNMTTKQAKAEDFAKASLGFGTDEYYRATVDLNKKINDTTALRLNAVGENSNGINRDVVENKKWGVAPALAFGLDTDTRLFLNYLHVEQNNILDGGVSTVGLKGFDAGKISSLADYPTVQAYLNNHKADPSTFYGSVSDFDDSTVDMFTARVEHDFSEQTRLSSTFRWGKLEHQYLATIPMSMSYDAANDTINISRTGNTGDSVNKILTNQTNLSTAFKTGRLEHALSTGIELTREEMDTFGHSATVLPTSLYNPDTSLISTLADTPEYSDGKINTYSFYAFDTIKLLPKLEVNGGIRLDHYELRSKGMSNTAGRGQPENYEFSSTRDDGDLFNWKAGILFKPTENGSLYANYAIQQQAPGTITGGDGIGNANAFTPSSSASSNNNLSLDPQEIKTAEIGTKWELFNQQLLLTGALFHTELTNEIESDATLPNVYYQSGKKTVKGVELGAVGRLTDNWQLTAGYTYQKSEVENVTQAVGTGAVTADGSDDIPFTPTDAFTLWSTYKTDRWSVGGGGRYMGEMKKSRDGNQAGPAVLEDYWVFDAMASYQLTKNIGVQFNVNNLFDEDYVASINRGGWRYYPGAERNYRVTFNFDF